MERVRNLYVWVAALVGTWALQGCVLDDSLPVADIPGLVTESGNFVLAGEEGSGISHVSAELLPLRIGLSASDARSCMFGLDGVFNVYIYLQSDFALTGEGVVARFLVGGENGGFSLAAASLPDSVWRCTQWGTDSTQYTELLYNAASGQSCPDGELTLDRVDISTVPDTVPFGARIDSSLNWVTGSGLLSEFRNTTATVAGSPTVTTTHALVRPWLTRLPGTVYLGFRWQGAERMHYGYVQLSELNDHGALVERIAWR